MKRSAMLEELGSLIRDIRYNKYLDNENAEILLTYLEKLGMRPPVVVIKDSGQFKGDEFTYEYDGWESEND